MVTMTDEQKYNAVLKELGEVLQSKNTTISCQQWQIDELKAKLEAAEKACDQAKETCERAFDELEDMALKLLAARNEIAEMKGGAVNA